MSRDIRITRIKAEIDVFGRPSAANSSWLLSELEMLMQLESEMVTRTLEAEARLAACVKHCVECGG